MVKAKYLYSIYDTEAEQYVLIDGNNTDVVNTIGIKKEKISQYVTNNYLFKGRYRITTCEIANPNKKVPELEISKKKIITGKDRLVMDKFNETMKYLTKHYPQEFLRRIIIVQKSEGKAAG